MPDYQKEIDLIKNNLRSQRKQKRIKDLIEKAEKENQEFKRIQNYYFDLLKNTTILAGTIFATSIALASGKKVNSIFIIGELFLFISTFFGAIFLWAQLKGEEWSHSMNVKLRLESDLIINKDIMEDFEKKTTEEIIGIYKKLMVIKSPVSFLLRLIKIDYIPGITLTTFLVGLFLIWLSLVNLNIDLSFIMNLIKKN